MTKTNTALWDVTARTNQPTWEDRAKIFAKFIRPTDTVLDLGAGDRKLKKYLAPETGYIPVDCTAELPGTFVVDFNETFALPDEPFSIIVSAGFIEYLADLDGFLSNLAARCAGIDFIFSYSYSTGKPPKKQYRKLGTLRTPDQVTQALVAHSYGLQEILRLKNQSLFSCTLTPQSNADQLSRPLLNDLIPLKRRWGRKSG